MIDDGYCGSWLPQRVDIGEDGVDLAVDPAHRIPPVERPDDTSAFALRESPPAQEDYFLPICGSRALI
ncbi:hypothetical protein G6M50_19015 [Agrobacterium rhizogenes]|nr:hypothetical protein [Rhizobium rhizogenes]NTJ79877.1 hypothetical protein [Rhizobium rhizogenes]